MFLRYKIFSEKIQNDRFVFKTEGFSKKNVFAYLDPRNYILKVWKLN